MPKNTRKRHGPKPTGKGTPLLVRVQPPLLKSLDRFIKEQPGKPSRPEAVRMILTDALTSYGLFPLDLPPPIKRDAN
jgi:hypothetical protein